MGKDGKRTTRSKPVIFAKLGIEADLDEATARGARDAFDRYLRRASATRQPTGRPSSRRPPSW